MEHRQQRVSKRWPYAITGAALGALVATALFLAARPQVIYFGGGNSCCCCTAEPCYSIPEKIPDRDKLGKRKDNTTPPPTTPPDDRTTIVQKRQPDWRSDDYWTPYLPFSGGGGKRSGGEDRHSNSVPVSVPGTLALVSAGVGLLIGRG